MKEEYGGLEKIYDTHLQPTVASPIEPVISRKKENTMLNFGDYCTIEQKRYGSKNELYQYKVIGNFRSNCYREVPVDGANTKHKHTKEMHDVLNVICCGVDETKVEKVRVCDVTPDYKGDFAFAC